MLVKENKHYEDYTSVTDFTEDATKLLFESYPIFDEMHREELNRKIVDHYLFDEIALTPYSKWQFMLNRKLREIMPYYNKLYLSELGIEDIYNDLDVEETLDRTVGTDTETNSSRENTNVTLRNESEDHTKNINTDTSQNEDLSANSQSETNRSDVPFNRNKNDEYPTESEKSNETSLGQNTYSGNQKEDEVRSNNRDVEVNDNLQGSSSSLMDSNTLEVYTKKMKGKNSKISKAEVLKQYRDTLLNVDMLIVEELADMFMFLLN